MVSDRASGKASLSLIVPSYNAADYLENCAESLFRQSGDDLEFIFIDDGSTDASGVLLDRYAETDPRVRVVHQQNEGASAARNVGLSVASGEYVCFVDADDTIAPDMASIALGAAHADDADIVVFNMTPIPPVDWILEVLDIDDALVRDDGRTILLTRRGCVPFIANKLYRRALLDAHDIRFNVHLRIGEDAAFQYLAFPEARTVTFISNKLYNYRTQLPDSATTRHSADKLSRLLRHIEVFEYILRTWEARGYLDGMRSELLQGCTYFFNDAFELDGARRMEFGRAFSDLYRRWFTPEVLRGTDPGIQHFYECFLAWGEGNRAKVFAARAKVKIRYRNV